VSLSIFREKGYRFYFLSDVDLEIDNLENPEKYPLKFESKKHLTNHSTGRRIARP
jgi:hypothetical protein